MERNANKTQRGIATLPTVGALVVFMIAISLMISTLSVNESFGSGNIASATRAILYAEVGARDALMRIARDKNYSCPADDCYQIEMIAGGCAGDNQGCVFVSVSTGTGVTGNPKTITSTGRVGDNSKVVSVNVLLDPSLQGRIATTSWAFQ